MRATPFGTRRLLAGGVIVGPVYLTVGALQGLLRDGFDFGRHALSHLANGPGGWIQTANFAVSGLLVIGAAMGIARAIRPRGRPGSWLLGAYGVFVTAAAVFRADPVDGFPPGTPEGFPTTISTSGLLHFVSGGLAFLSLALSCLALAVTFHRRGRRSVAALSAFSGSVVLLGFFGPLVLPLGSVGMAGIWLAVVVGWAWLALTCAHLLRATS